MGTQRIFLSGDLNEKFITDGYVTLPLLSSDEVEKLADTFRHFQSNYNGSFHTTHFSQDKVYKQTVHDSIAEVLAPNLEGVLNHYKPVFGNWMIKAPGGDNPMPLHADWTYVDENEHRSLAIWVPLVDTDEANGAFAVIAGSHKVTPSIRGPRIIQGDWRKYEDWIKRKGKILPTPAGHAVIYDHALLHYSPPNTSAVIRPALNLSCVPTDAQLYHYCMPEGSESILKYKVDDASFFIHYDNFQRPERGEVEYAIQPQSITTMDAAMETFTK